MLWEKEKYGGNSERVENTAGKGEIACYEQFLLFPQCFQKTCTADMAREGLFGKGLHMQLPLDLNVFPFTKATAASTYSNDVEHR